MYNTPLYMSRLLHLVRTRVTEPVSPVLLEILLLLLLLLLTAFELSLGGSSPYTSTDKTNNKLN